MTKLPYARRSHPEINPMLLAAAIDREIRRRRRLLGQARQQVARSARNRLNWVKHGISPKAFARHTATPIAAQAA